MEVAPMTVCPQCGMPTSRAYPCDCALECSECGERGGVAWDEHEEAWLCERCADYAEALREEEPAAPVCACDGADRRCLYCDDAWPRREDDEVTR